jgi:hypothetical protein
VSGLICIILFVELGTDGGDACRGAGWVFFVAHQSKIENDKVDFAALDLEAAPPTVSRSQLPIPVFCRFWRRSFASRREHNTDIML